MAQDESLLEIKHPKGLYILFFLESWERFSYWGIQSLLVLYLIKALFLTDKHAYVIYGAYTALTFTASVFGGITADKLLGFKQAIILGCILLAIGNITLAFSSYKSIFIGLSLIILGTGFIKSNCAGQLGTLYSIDDYRRDSGFTLYYVGTNIGGLLGPIFYGLIAERCGWHTSFILSSIGIIFSLLLYLHNIKIFPKINFEKNNLHFKIIFYLLLPVLLIGLWWLLTNPKFVGYLLNLVGLLTLTFLFVTSLINKAIEYNKLLVLISMIIFSLLFYACIFQFSTSLTLFIERHIHRTIFGWKVPTEMFVSLEPFFVIAVAPLVAQLWLRLGKRALEPSAPLKLCIGMLLASLGFTVFGIVAKVNYLVEATGLLWLIAGYLLIGLGEICIAPTVLSVISLLAPVRLQGTLMGTYYLALAFSSYIAGIIAKLTSSQEQTTALMATNMYASTYFKISLCAFFTGLIGIFLTLIFRKRYEQISKSG